MGDTPTNVPTAEVPKGYENPMLLYQTLDTSLKAEKGREFSRAYLDFLKKDNPKLYAELCAADEAGKGKEGGVYTKEQLAQVAEELDKYSADKFKEEMKSNGLQNVDQARFKFETGKVTIILPTAAEPLTLVQRFDSQEQGGQNWLLGDVPYHTSSEEVFEDVKQIQELISMWQKGELVATTSNPVEIAGSFTKVISFDGRDIGAAWNNTVGADNPQQLADHLNKIYGRIQNGPGPSEVAPQEVAVAASSSPTGEAVSAAPSAAPAEVSVSAPAEVAVDVHEDVKVHPENYITGDKKTSVTFTAQRGSDADLHLRIEELYTTPEERALTLTSANPKLAGMEFKYDAAHGSFYESKDGTFTDQRLVIRGGDTIATKPAEAAPAVADAQAPAAVDAATTVTATVEAAPVTVAEIDPQAAEKKAAQYISAIHTLADQAQHQTMVFAQNGTTREKDPAAWKQVDDKYAVIQRMLDDSAFDITKAPRTTAEEGIMADSVVALRDSLPQTLVALNVPDAKKDDGTRVVDNHDAPAAVEDAPAVDAAATSDAVTDGDTGTTEATPTPTTLG